MKKLSFVTLSLLLLIGGCYMNTNQDSYIEEMPQDNAYTRFLNNVIIKKQSPNYVTYEYKDVRVDELAILASRYCQEQDNRTAVLRDIILYKNYSRWATFDCLSVD